MAEYIQRPVRRLPGHHTIQQAFPPTSTSSSSPTTRGLLGAWVNDCQRAAAGQVQTMHLQADRREPLTRFGGDPRRSGPLLSWLELAASGRAGSR